MAKKRLNKKVAIIGSIVAALVILAAIVVILRLVETPDKFLRDADVALAAKDYKNAERNIKKAYGCAKTNERRIEIAFKLADFYLEQNEWNKAVGTWNKIIMLDTKNVKAREALLDFTYQAADAGQWMVWKDIESNASKLIELTPSPYLYLFRGRAKFEMTIRGQTTNRDKLIAEAIEDLQKAVRQEPNNVEAYWYLAQCEITKGNLIAEKGAFNETTKAFERAKAILEEAITIVPEEPKAHTNLMRLKLRMIKNRKEFSEHENEFLLITEKFPSSSVAFSTLSKYYQRSLAYKFDAETLDKAIDAAEKAVKFDSKNVRNAILAARLYYQKASILKNDTAMKNALETLQNALTLPGAQDVPGPRRLERRSHRLTLDSMLATCYIEQVLDNPEAEKDEWIAKTEQVVHDIEQIVGTAEHMTVVKWHGLIELAKGNTTSAVQKLYAAYQQFKASGTKDIQVSYRLAKTFENTTEIGAVADFLSNTFPDIMYSKPQAYLDFAELFLKFNDPGRALNAVNRFDELFSANTRSKLIRINAYTAAGQFDDAEKTLAQLQQNDAKTIVAKILLHQAQIDRLETVIITKTWGEEKQPGESEKTAEHVDRSTEAMNVEVKKHHDDQVKLLEELLKAEPNYVGPQTFSPLCQRYISTGDYEQAKTLINLVLQYLPTDTSALVYKQVLSEPDPANIPNERYRQITEQVLSGISDTYKRAMALAQFYENNDKLDKAAEEYQKAVEAKPSDTIAASSLLDIALANKAFELAEQLAKMARRENLDQCEGNVFAAHIAIAKKQYDQALARIDEALRQRPVYSLMYSLRRSANKALGNSSEAIEDAKKAIDMNPMNGAIAKQLAALLYQRNQQLGDKTTPEEIAETKRALNRARGLNPADPELLRLYIEYISQTNSQEALALLQRLYKAVPTPQNAIFLGNLATKLANEEINQGKKQAYIEIASAAFQQAYEKAPTDKIILNNYAEFYRRTNQPDKARQLLMTAQDENLLWKLHLRSGEFEQAKNILDKLYAATPNDTDILKSLAYIAQKTSDKDGIKKYSAELLALDSSIEAQLFQIEIFLQTGIINDAEKKLASFRERYPNEPKGILLEAWLVMRQGRLKKAMELINKYLEIDLDSAIAWRLRGMVNYLFGNYTQAIIDFQKSKSITDDPQLGVDLAKAYLRVGREDDAITELLLAVNDERAGVEARTVLEQTYLNMDNKEALSEFYNKTLKKFPNDVFWYKRAARFAMAVNNNDEAASLFEKAFQNSRKQGQEGDLEALNGYLQSLLNAKKYAKVVEYASNYIYGDLAIVAYAALADAKFHTHNKDAALQYYRKALEKAETNDDTIFSLLKRIDIVMGHTEAVKLCNEKLKTNPDSLGVNMAMYNVMRVSGEYNKALIYIDRCLEITKPDDPLRFRYKDTKANILLLAYNKTSDEKYLDRAIKEYQSIIAQQPNNIKMLNNLAYLLASMDRDLDKAMEYAGKAHNMVPDDENILDTYAYVLYKNGQYAKAVELSQSAVQLFERGRVSAPVEVYEHLGMANEKLGRNAEAITAYEQALKAGQGVLSEQEQETIRATIGRLRNQLQ